MPRTLQSEPEEPDLRTAQAASAPEEVAALDVHAEVRRFLVAFGEAVQEALSTDLVALYVSGSLLMGDFEIASSDIDFLGVTGRSLDAVDIERLTAVHARLAEQSGWGERLEGGYAAQSALRPWGIEGTIVAVAPGKGVEGVLPSDYSADNMIAIREHGLTLHDPGPALILPPVDRATLTTALRAYLAELVACPAATESSPAELASWILNIARCRYGLEFGRPCTKSEAATWLAQGDPELAPALESALSVRRGAAGIEAIPELRAGFALLQRDAAEQGDDGGI